LQKHDEVVTGRDLSLQSSLGTFPGKGKRGVDRDPLFFIPLIDGLFFDRRIDG
jgi:hypothetical protein